MTMKIHYGVEMTDLHICMANTRVSVCVCLGGNPPLLAEKSPSKEMSKREGGGGYYIMY